VDDGRGVKRARFAGGSALSRPLTIPGLALEPFEELGVG
jgi:hypothetical protein